MWQIPFRLCSTVPDNAPALRSRTLENNIIYLKKVLGIEIDKRKIV